MKKSLEIIGLPVFSILDGKEIGQVKDLIINPEEGKVDFILISDGSWYTGPKLLPFKDVAGIGEHAVTTESEKLLVLVSEMENAASILQRNVKISGSKVLTDKGNLIGIISEYEVDEFTGNLVRLEYKSIRDESETALVKADRVLTYGSDVIVVREMEGASREKEPAVQKREVAGDTAVSSEESKGAAFFKQKQREFLLGKRVTQDIKDSAGNVIIAAGTKVTEDILDLTEKYNKFIEISQFTE